MTLWRDCGNSDGWFALKLSDGVIYMIPLWLMEQFSYTKTVLSRSDIREVGKLFEEWVTML